jgi:hypothetical protein
MKKKNLFLMFLMAAVLTMGMVSCSNAEKGESWDKSTGTADESTLVKKTGVYTIDEPNKTITLIDSEGKPFIRLSNINFDTGSMSANLLFYDLNQAYIVGFNRSFSF